MRQIVYYNLRVCMLWQMLQQKLEASQSKRTATYMYVCRFVAQLLVDC